MVELLRSYPLLLWLQILVCQRLSQLYLRRLLSKILTHTLCETLTDPTTYPRLYSWSTRRCWGRFLCGRVCLWRFCCICIVCGTFCSFRGKVWERCGVLGSSRRLLSPLNWNVQIEGSWLEQFRLLQIEEEGLAKAARVNCDQRTSQGVYKDRNWLCHVANLNLLYLLRLLLVNFDVVQGDHTVRRNEKVELFANHEWHGLNRASLRKLQHQLLCLTLFEKEQGHIGRICL